MSAVEVKIPSLGESVNEGVIAQWVKGDGDYVETDETLLELETDKAMMEIPAESDGRLEVLVDEGETVEVGQVVAKLHPAEKPAESDEKEEAGRDGKAADAAEEPQEPEEAEEPAAEKEEAAKDEAVMSPAARKLVAENDLAPAAIAGTGKDGRITKQDVVAHLDGRKEEAPRADEPEPEPEPTEKAPAPLPRREPEGGEERVPMSRIRQRIAERLVEAQHTTASLTTFNDVDMSAILELRRAYKETFQERYGVKLGFMSLFGRACCLALRDFPEVNAYVEGDEIVYHHYVNLGIAVSTDRGLMVPVVKGADAMSLAELEQAINDIGQRARKNRITPDDLSGGTFSITNGGIFGSLLSTPILNPPQSGILGMHRIEERPVAVDGEVVIRPMMYLAVTYDHRLVDGKGAVSFLVRIKELLEDPARMLLEI